MDTNQATPLTDQNFLGMAIAGEFPDMPNGPVPPQDQTQEQKDAAAIEQLSEEVVDTSGQEAPVVEKEITEPTALDNYLKSLQEEEVQEPAVWTDEAKKALKGTFGVEDPDAFKQEYSTLKERVSQADEAIERAERIQKNIDSMPYELSQALNAVAEGKPFRPFLEKLAKGVSLSAPAKDVPEDALIDTYYSKKFTAEQREAIAEGDEALKGVWDEYVSLARDKHDALRSEERKAIEARGAQAKQMQEAARQADAAAVAYLKNEKALSTFADKGTIDKFLSGDLERELLYNDDGTRKPESFALLLAARHHKSIVDAIRKGALTQGKNEAAHRKHAALPDRPDQGAGKRPPVKEKDDKPTHVSTMLADIMGLP